MIPPADQPSPDAAPAKRPRFALFIATACGLGYIPLAPGTWGSLAGLVLAFVPSWAFLILSMAYIVLKRGDASVGLFFSAELRNPLFLAQVLLTILVAAIGVWSASKAAKFWAVKDPQKVVIDEVSGQHLTLLAGLGIPIWWRGLAGNPQPTGFAFETPWFSWHTTTVLNWKYLLLGFILFRLFDIWKPFPARQAESLPGGWGIMADDWVAAAYAAICLWVARAAFHL